MRPPPNYSNSGNTSKTSPSRLLGDKLQELALIDPSAMEVIEKLVNQLLVLAREERENNDEGRPA